MCDLPPVDDTPEAQDEYDDLARWLRDEERIAAREVEYCKCGSHVIGTYCYNGYNS